MKAEDIERMYCRYVLFSDAPTVPWPSLSQRARMAFAAMCRACEQHGIARTKAHAGPHVYPSGEFWRALDDEVAKENEDG